MTSDSEAQDRIQAFAEAVAESGEVWGLEHSEGWAVGSSEDDEDLVVMPFWSSEAGARACATEEWSDYRVSSIPVDDFLDKWLPGMHEDGYLVGLDWDPEMEGAEVEPEELAEALADLLDALE